MATHSIQLKNAIIHEIKKEQHEPISPKITAPSVIDTKKEGTKVLFKGINKHFGINGNGAQYGIFADTKSGLSVQEYINAYIKSEKKDDDFKDLSLSIYGELYDKAKSTSPASGGYISFAEYKSKADNFLIIGMLKPVPGISITDLKPEAYENIDVTKLYQVAKLNIDKYIDFEDLNAIEKQEKKYLSFVTPHKNKTASGYFIEALGCEKGDSSAICTKKFITTLTSFTDEHPDVSNEMKPKIQKRFNEKLSELANLTGNKKREFTHNDIEEEMNALFPKTIDGDLNPVTADLFVFLSDDDIQIPASFFVDKNTVKRFTKISYSSDNNWSVEIDKDMFGLTDDDDIQLDEDGRTLTFKNLSDSEIDGLLKASSKIVL